MTLTRALIAFAMVAAFDASLAQGGPPVVTDDPETPGDAHWEINFGTVAEHTHGGWDIAAPDADINYGWGDQVQLKLDVPWTTRHERGGQWQSGLGTAFAGVKWRFIDQESAGFAMSVYPQYGHSILHASTKRGLTTDGYEFFLPLEVSTEAGGFGFAAEAGRDFAEKGVDGWEAGVVASHACSAAVECIAEVHFSQFLGDRQTLLNLGLHWKLDETMTLLAAAGRDFGTRSDDQRGSILYMGLQFAR